MPVSIVVGAQYGSEGKGKVALEWARLKTAIAAVRVGGSNSGHTVVRNGRTFVFRHLPTACVLPDVLSIIPPGAYLDVEILLKEIEDVGLDPSRVVVDPRAVIITPEDALSEAASGLMQRIGSTGSGTGAAVVRRVSRDGSTIRAADVDLLRPFLGDTLPVLREKSDAGRVLLEGTQGYGLSLLHGDEGDFATSRDTTAAGFLSETGLSPLDVDEIVLVARTFPIRVAGNSGKLENETTWQEVGEAIGRPTLTEFTTVTKKLRRIGEFEPDVVLRAVLANNPTHIVLNHLDYVADPQRVDANERIQSFLRNVETTLGRPVDYVGLNPETITPRQANFVEPISRTLAR